MRRIKGHSSLKLFQKFPPLKNCYWGRHFWASGYFCVISGDLIEEMTEEYLYPLMGCFAICANCFNT